MHKRIVLLSFLLWLPQGFGLAESERLLTAQDSIPLPVRKVVLYKNGMGYFEHLGPVRGAQAVEISLPRTQLNDVLKSLTVLDLGRGMVTGVTYDSSAPLDRRLAELPIDLDSAQGTVGLLNQLRGAAVEIKAPGGSVTGKIVGAELRTRSAGAGTIVQYVQITLLSSGGELRLIDLESAGSLRFTEPELAADMARYMELLNTTHRRDIRKLHIQTAGSGERQLYVSYTSEAPVWKTTYRVVLDPKQKPLLQGWAIVDNTTPVDWLDVTLSLVAGAPVSFIQNLSQPVYARRPVVPLPEGFQVSPQLHEGTMAAPGGMTAISGSVFDSRGGPLAGAAVVVIGPDGSPLRTVTTDGNGVYLAQVAAGNYRVSASYPGLRGAEYPGIEVTQGRTTALNFSLQGAEMEAMADDRLSLPKRRAEGPVAAIAPAAAPMEAAMERAGGIGGLMRQEAPPGAETQALGEQFEYRLKQPVTIRRNESGLLPILHAEVEGEKVSLYNASAGERRPRLAVWLRNSSGLTLDSGSFTVIDTNAFAGEGLVDTIQPGESRLLSYALDLGLEVTGGTQSERQRVERVEIHRGILRMHSKLTEKRSYVIRNNDEKARAVILEHPVRTGWKMADTPPPAESSASYHRFRVEAKAKATTEFTVREETPQETTYIISNVTPEQIQLWVRERSIDPEIEKALSGIVARKAEINAFAQKMAELDREQNEIFRDQERVRGNLARLGQTPEEASLRQRYIRQLEQQETRLGAIRMERNRLETGKDAAQKQLDDMLQKLTLDRKV